MPLTKYFGKCLNGTLQPHRYPDIYLGVFYLQSHHLRWQRKRVEGQRKREVERERERKKERENCCNAGADHTSGLISMPWPLLYVCHQFGL